MARIEDYALVGDTHSAALVSLDGSIDWLCLPRFDAESCFGAILDPEMGGCWRLAPANPGYSAKRAYRGDSLVLATTFETETGSARVVDCMPLSKGDPDDPRAIEPEATLLRVVTGIEGDVDMIMELSARFDYGRSVPWIHEEGDVVEAAVGPDALDLSATVDLEVDGRVIRASFSVSEGDAVAFVCRYRSSDMPRRTQPSARDWQSLVEHTERFWNDWAARCGFQGRWRDQVVRSLVTMKALTYSPTGGLVAAATTSLPERVGGSRNWDYRYCWLRDATLALEVLLDSGYRAEAEEFHDWILRALGGDADQLQVMYSITGERRLLEYRIDWLAGYEDSRPVRVGNAATQQFQLDVCGELMDLFHTARRAGIDPDRAWSLQVGLAELVCKRWRDPDNGIWEMRSGRRHYVHSKAMAWVALDRAVKAVRKGGKSGPVERWEQTRDEIRSEIMRKGIDRRRGCLKMSFGTSEVDASLLRLPLVGLLPAKSDVMIATIEAIERDLVEDGLVRRYRAGEVNDGTFEPEGCFFLCTFWLVCCYVLLGRPSEAEDMFGRATSLANDVGLFAEQYDPSSRRQLGNFPQAFSHFSLVTAALAIERGEDAPGLNRAR